MTFIFHFIYGMSSFSLTNSIIFQDGYCTTNQRWVCLKMEYPLVNVYITIENHHVQWVNPLFQWPFSIAMLTYPEGKPSKKLRGFAL